MKNITSINKGVEHVPLKLKLCLAIGSFASSMLMSFTTADITFFYEEKLLLDQDLVSLAWIIFAIWNTLNNPLFAFVIDNTRSKLGRRIPYIRYIGLIYGLLFILCWFPVARVGDQAGLFINLLVVLSLLGTAYTVLNFCFFALPKEIVVTAAQRSNLAAWLALANFVNLGAGVVLGILFLTGQAGINPLFQPFMIFVGIAASVLLFTTSFGLKENISAQDQARESFMEAFRSTLKNKPFWIIMLPIFVLSIVSPLVQTGVLYYITYVIPGQNYILVAGAFAIGILAGLTICSKLVRKLQPKRVVILFLLVLAFSAIVIFFTGKVVEDAVIPFGLFGLGIAITGIVTAVILGDIIDNDELITGKRREVIYGGVYAVITRPAISIANWAFLATINAFGFVSPVLVGNTLEKQPQSGMAITGILAAICIIPAICIIASAIAIRWYNLDGAEWLRKKEFIRELHEKKEKEFLGK